MSTPASWREPRHPDHYHWLTARLAARGARAATGRVIAAATLGLGIIPVILMFTSVGSAEPSRRLLAAGVAVCSVCISLLWLRASWPTRTQSALCVVVGSLCIAASSLASPRPLIGLLGATSFAVLAGFTAIFHGRRLLAWVWALAAVVLSVLAMRLTEWDTTVAICCLVLVAVIILFATFVSRALLGLIDVDNVTGRIEPVTGLLNRDGFDDGVATILAVRGRQDDRYLVVAIVSLDSFSIALDLSRTTNHDRARVAIGTRLRETVRRDAVLAHVAEDEFLVADVFAVPDPAPLTERIRDAVRATSKEMAASIGSATTALAPLAGYSPHEVTEKLLEHATVAMAEARRKGGNQSHNVHVPDLTKPGPPSAD